MRLQSIAASFALAGALFAAQAVAQTAAAPVSVENAWVRAPVAGQKATGAFMRITAKTDQRLVRADSPVAGVTEVHEMAMDGNVMRMRAIPALDVPAGKPVELKPGSYHVMLMDLKAPLEKGTNVPLTLVFQDAKGVQSQLQLQVPVTDQPAAAKMQHKNAEHSH